MSPKQALVRAVNYALRPLHLQLVENRTPMKPWDRRFAQWIAEGEALEKDPNDIGDEAWSPRPDYHTPSLKEAMERYYLPHVKPNSTVLELGPGTGRVTRHIIGRCERMVLVDYSQFVCEWLEKYLEGKGNYRVVQIGTPAVPTIENGSVDVVIANGVFEHMDLDDMSWFIDEFYRVLRPGGTVIFNFDNIMAEEGIKWFKLRRGVPGDRCIFRFHHPETVERLAAHAGFEILEMATGVSRFAYVRLGKPSGQLASNVTLRVGEAEVELAQRRHAPLGGSQGAR